MEVRDQFHTPANLSPEKNKNPLPTEQETGMDSEPVWMVLENRKSLVLRTPDRSARSESLNRLRCPVSYNNTITTIRIIITNQTL